MTNNQEDRKKSETLAFSPEFHKARLRLIYFCAIGSLLSIFAIDSKSSLFGLSFENLTPNNVAIIFFFINSVFFVDHVIRIVEEAPKIWRKSSSAYKRYIDAINVYTQLGQQVGYYVERLEAECENLERHNVAFSQLKPNCSDDIEVINQYGDVAKKYGEITQQLRARTVEVREVLSDHRRVYYPGSFPAKMGDLRLWIEYISGISAFGIYMVTVLYADDVLHHFKTLCDFA